MKSPSLPGALRHHRARREAMKRAITAPWRNRVRLGDYCPIDRSRSVWWTAALRGVVVYADEATA